MKKFLIVGLGNVGEKYDNTRHNVGFSILDRLADKNECVWESRKLASYTLVKKKGKQFVLIKPTTFMNRSGKAVRYWALKENIPLELEIRDSYDLYVSDIIESPSGYLEEFIAYTNGGIVSLQLGRRKSLNMPDFMSYNLAVGMASKKKEDSEGL